MVYAQLKNEAGNFVSPSASAFQAAAAGADWNKAPGFYLLLTNQPGKDSWPIAGATFILLHKVQHKPATAKQVIQFFDWAYHNGDKLAESLDYVPMPDKVVKLIENAWRTEVKGADGKAVWRGSGS